ncbi:MAG: hypothetical protein LBG07_06280 [Treponema sp.]|jgi:hypothetical protein|nr:hypothetical protein [Treponema sp.]
MINYTTISPKKAIRLKLKARFVVFILTAALPALLEGCSGRIDGNLRQDGSAELSLEINIEPRMGAMLRSLASLGAAAGRQGDRGAPVIDGPAIARSLVAAPGILSADLANTGPAGIAGTVRASRVDELFAMPGVPEQKRFITLGTGQEPGDKRLSAFLDRETAPLLLAMISANVRDYLSALFAPAATGDALTRAEYLDLVEDIYGKALADEIAAAEIAVTVGFPGAIRSVKGGTYSGSSAAFAIALADILVLEEPLEYEVIWK